VKRGAEPSGATTSGRARAAAIPTAASAVRAVGFVEIEATLGGARASRRAWMSAARSSRRRISSSRAAREIVSTAGEGAGAGATAATAGVGTMSEVAGSGADICCPGRRRMLRSRSPRRAPGPRSTRSSKLGAFAEAVGEAARTSARGARLPRAWSTAASRTRGGTPTGLAPSVATSASPRRRRRPLPRGQAPSTSSAVTAPGSLAGALAADPSGGSRATSLPKPRRASAVIRWTSPRIRPRSSGPCAFPGSSAAGMAAARAFARSRSACRWLSSCA
jgi:hypothetical protein